MTDGGLDLVVRQHGRLDAEGVLEFGVVDSGIARGDHQNVSLFSAKGHGFRDACRFTAERCGGKRHRGAGGVQFAHAIGAALCGKKCFHFFNGHDAYFLCSGMLTVYSKPA